MAVRSYIYNSVPRAIEFSKHQITLMKRDDSIPILRSQIESVAIAYWGEELVEYKPKKNDTYEQLLKSEKGICRLLIKEYNKLELHEHEINNSNKCISALNRLLNELPDKTWKGIGRHEKIYAELNSKDFDAAALFKSNGKIIILLYISITLMILLNNFFEIDNMMGDARLGFLNTILIIAVCVAYCYKLFTWHQNGKMNTLLEGRNKYKLIFLAVSLHFIANYIVRHQLSQLMNYREIFTAIGVILSMFQFGIMIWAIEDLESNKHPDNLNNFKKNSH